MGETPSSASPGTLPFKDERTLTEDPQGSPRPKDRDVNALLDEISLLQIEVAVRNEELRASQIAAHEARVRFSDLYDSSPVGYFTFSRVGVIEEANLAAAALLGIDRFRLIGTPLAVFLNQNSGAFYSHLEEVFATDRKASCEVTLRRKDKSLFFASLESLAFVTPDHKVARTVITDITERKAAERQILNHSRVLDGINRILTEAMTCETEEKLGQVCLSVAEGLTESKMGFIGEMKADGLIHDITISDPGWELCRMYDKTGHRRPPGQFKVHGLYGYVLRHGRSLLTNTPADHPESMGIPEGHPPLTAFLGVPLVENETVVGIAAVGNREGGYEVEHQRMLEALAPAIIQSLYRKRAEDQVRRSRDELETRVEERTAEVEKERRRLYDVLETVPAMVCLLTPDYNVPFANRAFRERYGECNGRKCFDYCFGRKEPCDFCESFKVLRTGEPHHWEVGTPGGFIVDAYDFPFTDADGSRLVLEMNLDITARRRAEEENARIERQLRQAQKMKALGTLTGGIAHDFNNILAAIIGFGELAKDRTLKGSIVEGHLAKLLQAGMRGRDLVKQMLAFSRSTEQVREPLPLGSLVKEAMKLLRASIPSTIQVKVKAENESSLVLADPTQMQQVLMNLCTNAAHAMREQGGVLDVGVSDCSASAISGNDGVKEGDYVRLMVRDTGVGIAPEIVERIFDPFFTTKKQTEGTGLGLSVVHGIVQRHDGCIAVESQPGEGSTFFVYLPKVGEASAKRASARQAVPAGHERLLFIDDEEALTSIGREALQRLGYEVTVMNDPVEALGLFRTDPAKFNLVITDQTMPRLTGMEVFAQIRSIRDDIPVILITGHSDLIDPERAREAGIGAYVTKPVTKGDLARTIRKVLDTGKSG